MAYEICAMKIMSRLHTEQVLLKPKIFDLLEPYTTICDVPTV
jgi:hypothetical protein